MCFKISNLKGQFKKINKWCKTDLLLLHKIQLQNVAKVVCAIPQWAGPSLPILTQTAECTKTLTGPTGKLLKLSLKHNYKSKIKTMMAKLHYKNLDFLLSDVLGVLKFLDNMDNLKEDKGKCQTHQFSRGYETACVTCLPLAKLMILIQEL